MTRPDAFPLTPRMALFISAVAVGAALYYRKAGRAHNHRHDWNRLDRHSSIPDLEDGSFPASDPPSSVPSR